MFIERAACLKMESWLSNLNAIHLFLLLDVLAEVVSCYPKLL